MNVKRKGWKSEARQHQEARRWYICQIFAKSGNQDLKRVGWAEVDPWLGFLAAKAEATGSGRGQDGVLSSEVPVVSPGSRYLSGGATQGRMQTRKRELSTEWARATLQNSNFLTNGDITHFLSGFSTTRFDLQSPIWSEPRTTHWWVDPKQLLLRVGFSLVILSQSSRGRRQTY